MRRFLRRVHLLFLPVSFCNLKSHKCGRRHVIDLIKFSRNVTTLIGHDFVEYGLELTTKSIQEQIFNALRQGERDRASILLRELSSANCSLRADDFIDIFKYCARSNDPLFAMETWRIMEEKEITLEGKCYLHMMRALCNGGYLDQASHMIKFIKESHDIYPSLPLYNSFLRACVEMQRMDYVNQCLDLMEHEMVGKNESTYSELLKLAVWQQNLSAVHEIWKDYIKHYSLTIDSLRNFIWSFTRLKDLKSAFEMLQRMVALVLQGSAFFIGTKEGRLYSSRLDIPIPLNGQLDLEKFESNEKERSSSLMANTYTGNIQRRAYFDMGNKDVECVGIDELANKTLPAMKVLRWSFSDVIHACAQNQNCGLAEQLMLQMQKLGLQPSSHTCDGFVKAIVSERGFDAGMEMLNTMRKMNIKPYDTTLAAISINCCKVLELDLAEVLLDQISDCSYPHPFNAFLAACNKLDQPERAVRMLAKMKQLKVQPDIVTYKQLFALFGRVNAPYERGNLFSMVDSAKRIKAMEMDMAKNGLQHSLLSMMNLLKALGAEGMTSSLIQYLHLAEELFCHTHTDLGTPFYNIVLHSLVEAKESQLAIEIFKNMKTSGFSPDAATYNIMIDCCSIIKCYKSACVLFSMMLRDGFCPQACHYTALMKILLKCDDIDEALNILDRGNSEEFPLDVVFYNTILEKAWVKGRIDVIELVIEQMRLNKIRPDPTTCRYVFCTYVKRGFHNTAVEALQVLSMRMICEEDSGLQDLKAKFEDFILSEDKEAELQILQFFVHSKESIAVALFNLRWCSILGFPLSWSPNRTPWARRLCANYDSRKKIT